MIHACPENSSYDTLEHRSVRMLAKIKGEWKITNYISMVSSGHSQSSSALVLSISVRNTSNKLHLDFHYYLDKLKVGCSEVLKALCISVIL